MANVPKIYKSNPTLRKILKEVKEIADNAKKGDKIMCPCGCLTTFVKKTDVHCFSQVQGKKCKDRYHNRVKSKANNRFNYTNNFNLIRMRDGMQKYIEDYYRANPKPVKESKPRKEENLTLEFISTKPTSENYIKMLKEVRKIAKLSHEGERVFCPCGCMKTFIKNTGHHTYSRENGNKHKDTYYEVVRSNEPVKMTEEKIVDFNILRDYLIDNIRIQKMLEHEKRRLRDKKTPRKVRY